MGGQRGDLSLQPPDRACLGHRRLVGICFRRERANDSEDRAWGPNYGPYAPVHAAEELGYYKQNGIKAEVTAYRGGGAAQEALAAGAADMISFFPPGAALAVKKGIKEKVVGIGAATPVGWHLVVMSNSPYRTVKDLAGKKIGVTAKASTTDFYALWAADRAGVRVDTIPVGAPGLIPTLKSGQIDAAVMHSPLPFKLIIPGEGRSLIDLGKEMEPTLPDVWIATQSIMTAIQRRSRVPCARSTRRPVT